MTLNDKLNALYGKSEAKLNAELQKLRNEMEASRCRECGLSGYEHQSWCPKRKA